MFKKHTVESINKKAIQSYGDIVVRCSDELNYLTERMVILDDCYKVNKSRLEEELKELKLINKNKIEKLVVDCKEQRDEIKKSVHIINYLSE